MAIKVIAINITTTTTCPNSSPRLKEKRGQSIFSVPINRLRRVLENPIPCIKPKNAAYQKLSVKVPGVCSSEVNRLEMAVKMMVTTISSSTTGTEKRIKSSVASASVMECPNVNAVIMASSFLQAFRWQVTVRARMNRTWSSPCLMSRMCSSPNSR